MKIGFLHIGSPNNGIRRYGELLASEAGRHREVEVLEAAIKLTGDRPTDALELKRAAKLLSACALVQLQFNKRIWGFDLKSLSGRRAHLWNLRTFLRHCQAPIAVTLHDLYFEKDDLEPLSVPERRTALRALARIISTMLWKIGEAFEGNRAIARQLVATASVAFVSTREELRRLGKITDTQHVRVIPLLVEHRCIDIDPSKARAELGLSNKLVITILGFLIRRKGYELVVEAMKQLRPKFYAVFAGGPAPGGEAYAKELQAHIETAGLCDHIRITGFIPDREMQLYLRATHLAVLPFTAVSASSSLSTWISSGGPILTSELSQFLDFNEIEAGAIRTFSPYTAEAFAIAVKSVLEQGTDAQAACVRRLADELSPSRLFATHLQCYRDALDRSSDSLAK